jgi:hypothetical protein
LNGFLQAAHGAIEFADGVVGLFDQSAHDRVVLGGLAGKVLLTLQQSGNVALQLYDFAGNSLRGPWTDQAAAKRADQESGCKSSEIAKTHEELLLRDESGLFS